MTRVLVNGTGGFIGSHLVRRLTAEGRGGRGEDLKYPEFSDSPANEFTIGDLRDRCVAEGVSDGMDRPRISARCSYMISDKLGWRLTRPLREGLAKTYARIAAEVEKANVDSVTTMSCANGEIIQ